VAKIKVLILDNDTTSRDILNKSLEESKDIEVVGIAFNEKIALDKMRLLNPDAVIFGNNFNDLSASLFTKKLLEAYPGKGVIIITDSNSKNQASDTIEALGHGAFDVVLRPDPNISDIEKIKFIERNLSSKIRCFSIKKFSRMARLLTPIEETQPYNGNFKPSCVKKYENSKFEIVLIGVSTGGPEVLTNLIPEIPKNFPIPILIVMHMPKIFTKPMSDSINRVSKIKFKEAEDNEVLKTGTGYLAPGGIHLIIRRNLKGELYVLFEDTPPVNSCKPAVDVLFKSAVGIVREKAISVVLTGMGSDGTEGVRALKENNVPCIVQDKESSVVWGMPGSVAEAGLADEILPLNMIAKRLTDLVMK